MGNNSFSLTAIWLTHDQLWANIEGSSGAQWGTLWCLNREPSDSINPLGYSPQISELPSPIISEPIPQGLLPINLPKKLS